MKRLLIPLILFFITVLEGVALELLPAQFISSQSYIVPHWVFIVLIFVALFYDKEDTYFAVLYGIIFGLLIDVVYTELLGVYMFSYALVIYFILEAKKLVHTNLFVAIILGILGICLVDIFIYFIYITVGFVHVVFTDYLIYRLLPTVLANLIFLILFYPLAKSKFPKWRSEQLLLK